LMSFSERLSVSNENLRKYNSQITARMQERDEDLARSYDKINRLEKRQLKFIIAIVVMGAVIAGMAILTILLLKRR